MADADEGEPGTPERLSFDEARERLRARGYLDRGVEGAVLMGALAARTRARGILRAAAVAALVLAGALALSLTAVVAVSSGLGARDVALLFLWLFLGALLFAAALVALLVGLAALRVRGRADAEHASTEVGVAFGLLAGLGGALAALPALDSAGPAAAAAVLVAVATAVFLSVRVARGLTLTVLVASGRAILARRTRAGVFAAGLFATLAAAAAIVLGARKENPRNEPLVVRANTRSAIVVGVDGWSPRYAGRDVEGGLSYRKAGLDPAAFWTTVATGEDVRRHGVGSLDLVHVAGLSAAIRPVAGTEWYFGRLLHALRLARRESVTSASRHVPAMWEVAQRAGVASLVVSWWTTYPAGEGGGTVLSNHLFFAARAGASLQGEGWPPEAAQRAARLAPRVAPEPGSLDRLVADAEGLDAFAIGAFREAFAREKPRLALLYLPGPDILGAALSDPTRSTADRVELADALKKEAARIETFLAKDLPAFGANLTVTVLDGGRQSPGGEVKLSGALARANAAELNRSGSASVAEPNRSGSASAAEPNRSGSASAALDPRDIAPTVLAVLGVPASREIGGRVRAQLLVPDAASSATVGSWGRSPRRSEVPVDAKEYVENLRSLGYLK